MVKCFDKGIAILNYSKHGNFEGQGAVDEICRFQILEWITVTQLEYMASGLSLNKMANILQMIFPNHFLNVNSVLKC